MSATTFYLGTHQPYWLRLPEFADVPLFVSRSQLTKYAKMPKRGGGRWALDSGGFTELKTYGRWRLTAEEYVADVRRMVDGVGTMPDFVAQMDEMCEPWVIEGKNWHLKPSDPRFFHGTRALRGLGSADTPGEDEQGFGDAVLIHQRNTVANALELAALAPDIPWLYVIQGWSLEHYLRCVRMYAAAGVDLSARPVVGVGSVCRRQATSEIGEIVTALSGLGIRLHGFGVKKDGLEKYRAGLVSADSMAWSFHYRRMQRPAFPGHGSRHKNCANCPEAALEWRQEVLDVLDGARIRQTVRKPAELAA